MVEALVQLAVASYGIAVAALYLGQRHIIFRPDRSRPSLAAVSDLGVREVVLKSEGGIELLCWYLPPRGDAPVILHCHGNGGHIGRCLELLLRAAEERHGLFLIGYRGYGGNRGRPSEAGLYADAEAGFNFLTEAGIASERIVIFGTSLGSGVASWLAARHQIAALVLEAPFTRLADIARRRFPLVPVALLLRHRFDNLALIGRVRAPILVLHGERDDIVPIAHGRALLATAREPKEGWFAPEAGHCDLARFGALDVVFSFLARHLRADLAQTANSD